MPSRLRERILPSPEVLAVRLADIGRELGEARSELARYRSVNAEFEGRLAALADRCRRRDRHAAARRCATSCARNCRRAPEGTNIIRWS
ncbi:MAG: hypothetical protein MZV65_33605 [Chromatiales bacterium]|nr:hypothetical protein [Chromatiales bacterium]